jgi:hypothetical protein
MEKYKKYENKLGSAYLAQNSLKKVLINKHLLPNPTKLKQKVPNTQINNNWDNVKLRSCNGGEISSLKDKQICKGISTRFNLYSNYLNILKGTQMKQKYSVYKPIQA